MPEVIPWHVYLATDPRMIHHAPAWATVAVRSTCLSAIVNTLHAQMIAPLIRSWQGQIIAVIMEGTYEIAMMGDGVAAFNSHMTYCDTLRELGARVVVATARHTGRDEAARLDFNNYMRALHRRHAEGLIDVAGSDVQADEAGQRHLADMAGDVIEPMLSTKPAMQYRLALPWVAR